MSRLRFKQSCVEVSDEERKKGNPVFCVHEYHARIIVKQMEAERAAAKEQPQAAQGTEPHAAGRSSERSVDCLRSEIYFTHAAILALQSGANPPTLNGCGQIVLCVRAWSPTYKVAPCSNYANGMCYAAHCKYIHDEFWYHVINASMYVLYNPERRNRVVFVSESVDPSKNKLLTLIQSVAVQPFNISNYNRFLSTQAAITTTSQALQYMDHQFAADIQGMQAMQAPPIDEQPLYDNYTDDTDYYPPENHLSNSSTTTIDIPPTHTQ